MPGLRESVAGASVPGRDPGGQAEAVTASSRRWSALLALSCLAAPGIVAGQGMITAGRAAGVAAQHAEGKVPDIAFRDIAGPAGLDFFHSPGAPPVSQYILEVTGSGAAVFDFDNDGLLDIFVSSYTTPRERDLDSFIYWNRPGRGFGVGGVGFAEAAAELAVGTVHFHNLKADAGQVAGQTGAVASGTLYPDSDHSPL